MTDVKIKGDAAILIELGDMDDDGKPGLKVRLFGDIPFDGDDDPKELIESPEFEVDAKEMFKKVLGTITGRG